MKINKSIKISLITIITFSLSGCLGSINKLTCNFREDNANCYKWSAIQEGDHFICENINSDTKAETTKLRNECYYKISVNIQDYNLCSKISGKDNIYTKSNCILEIIKKFEDPQGCNKFLPKSFEYENCISLVHQIINVDKVSNIKKQIKEMNTELEQNPKDSELQSKILESKKELEIKFQSLTNEEKKIFIKLAIEQTLININDNDVKETCNEKIESIANGNSNINILLDQFEIIKSNIILIKKIDLETYIMIEIMKNKIMNYIDITKQDIIYPKITDYENEKGFDWLEKNYNSSLENKLNQLLVLQKQYNFSSDLQSYYKETYKKFTEITNTITKIYKNIDIINQKIINGQISNKKGNFLKRALILGLGLKTINEYTTEFESTRNEVLDNNIQNAQKITSKKLKLNEKTVQCISNISQCDLNTIEE